MKMLTTAALAAAFALGATALAGAQSYPAKPVTLLIPFSAGGPTDVIARLLAQVMSADLGQQVLVENATGAGGTLASGRLAAAAPDGYTVLLHHMGIATSVSLYDTLPYDPQTAFGYVGQVTTVPMLLVSRPDYPAENFAQLLERVRADPAATLLANAGPGAVSHLCGMLFMNAVGVQLTTVPYPGTGPALTDTMGGQVDLLCDQTTGATSAIQTGAVKAYATATPERIPTLPSVPTAKDQGLAGFEIGVWHGMFVPAGTPEAVRDRLTASLRKALDDETVVRRFRELGTAPVSAADRTPASLEQLYKTQIDFWAPIIRQAGANAG